MLTYHLQKADGRLYERLYEAIKQDILDGRIKEGERLPSKRALAEHLQISKATVETAYAQLMAEGYIYSEEKRGYFADRAEIANRRLPKEVSRAANPPAESDPPLLCDFSSNIADAQRFPFSIWIKLMRSVVLDYEKELLRPLPHNGALPLRCAIADYLYRFRGIEVSPENIVVGAGTEYLYGLIPQLLGRDRIFAVEDPGYDKARYTYKAHGADCVGLPLDDSGVSMDALRRCGADILHISPSHHFPTGRVTPAGRRRELFDWALETEDRYIVEDDYDWEFRLFGKPIPPMQCLDNGGRILYINTFSKSLSPSLRISYMVLPPQLMERYRTQLDFYACTVPSFEQYTLARFMKLGYFEKHIARMKKYYRTLRNIAVNTLRETLGQKAEISEEDAGLHFIMKLKTNLSDSDFCRLALERGVRVKSLSDYSLYPTDTTRSFVINYSGTSEEQICAAFSAFREILRL